ncbi:MAG TPA: hypothetical protein VG538_08005 [Vicinamibacterales bacterium]|nr:hypothetical protein [Vicinamibacterales bacterium]
MPDSDAPGAPSRLPQLDGLHDDAKRRFDEQGIELLRHVMVFREPERQPSADFKPNIFHARAVTDQDIVGDVHLGWQNRDGDPIGLAVAEVGGTRKGFVGEGFKKLEILARSMGKARPFASIASIEFLQAQIFEWAKTNSHAQPAIGCSDFILKSLAQAATERRIIIPISDLYVESPLAFGSVTITTFPDTLFQQFEARRLPEGESADDHVAWCKSLRSDFQGLAVAEARVFGEPIRARELAIEQIELVVGILRFFAPAHLDVKVVSRIARWGYAPQRTSMTFVADSDGRCSTITTALIDQPGRAVLDDKLKGFLLGAGLSEVREIVSRETRTQLEQSLLAGMVTFGQAALTPDLRARIVWYCAGLESILLKNSSEPILHNLGDRLAMFGYDSVDERATALADVRAAYSLRSDFVHHGLDVEDREIINRFAHHGLKFFLRLAKNVNRFSTREQFIEYIDRMKLSGGQH